MLIALVPYRPNCMSVRSEDLRRVGSPHHGLEMMIVFPCQLEALFGYRLFESIEEASTPYSADTRFVRSDHRVMFGRGKALGSS
jgi:hypothetical protein